MNNQKGLSSLLLVVVITIVIGGYFLYSKNIVQNQKKPTPEGMKILSPAFTLIQKKFSISSSIGLP